MKPKRVERIIRARDLGLPPRDDALALFDEKMDEHTRRFFLNGLLSILWDAQEKDDLSSIREWIAVWYYDLRFESDRNLSVTLASLPESAHVQMTAKELADHLGLH